MAYERRQFIRVSFDAPASLTTTNGTFQVHVHDLSLKGALVDLPAGVELEAGTLCQLKLTLAPSPQHITMSVEVARGHDQHTGLRCLHMDLYSITHLRRLIEWQLGAAELLERDLAQLVSNPVPPVL